MVIVTIECETTTPGRTLIHVKTVADTLGVCPAVDRAFSDLSSALVYLGDWLHEWSRARGGL
jgi:hypothetical protein